LKKIVVPIKFDFYKLKKELLVIENDNELCLCLCLIIPTVKLVKHLQFLKLQSTNFYGT
jgi:hypothetical protein